MSAAEMPKLPKRTLVRGIDYTIDNIVERTHKEWTDFLSKPGVTWGRADKTKNSDILVFHNRVMVAEIWPGDR